MIFLATTEEKLALIILSVCLVAIGGLIIAALVLRIRSARRQEIKRIKDLENKEVTEEEKNEFLLVYGGSENICDVVLQRSKINVTVKDVEKVSGEGLKNLEFIRKNMVTWLLLIISVIVNFIFYGININTFLESIIATSLATFLYDCIKNIRNSIKNRKEHLG